MCNPTPLLTPLHSISFNTFAWSSVINIPFVDIELTANPSSLICSNNSKDFLYSKKIDGVLVGGASLDVQVFSKIINFN